jgi:hypothetical protein
MQPKEASAAKEALFGSHFAAQNRPLQVTISVLVYTSSIYHLYTTNQQSHGIRHALVYCIVLSPVQHARLLSDTSVHVTQLYNCTVCVVHPCTLAARCTFLPPVRCLPCCFKRLLDATVYAADICTDVKLALAPAVGHVADLAKHCALRPALQTNK